MPDESSNTEPDYSDPMSIGQDRLVDAIKVLPWMAARSVPVESERRGDIVQTVTNAVNKLGVAVCVLEPVIGVLDAPEEPGLEMDVEYVVEIVENVTLNRSAEPPADGEPEPVRATALQVATRIIAGLHGHPTRILNPRHPMGLFRADRTALRRLPHKVLSIYQIKFHVGISLADLQ